MSVVIARRVKEPDDLGGPRLAAQLKIDSTADSRDTTADTHPSSTVPAESRAGSVMP